MVNLSVSALPALYIQPIENEVCDLVMLIEAKVNNPDTRRAHLNHHPLPPSWFILECRPTCPGILCRSSLLLHLQLNTMPRAPIRRRNLSRHRPSPRVPSDSHARSHLERKLAATPIGQRPNDSDDSDRLVVKGNGRGSKRRQEIYASGAVRGNDRPGSFPTRAQRRKSLSNDTREILAQAQTKVLQAANVGDGTSQPTSSSRPLDAVASSLAPSLNPRGSASKPAQPTPIRDSSILGTLKPRRRQPSILQLVDHDSSSFDLDDEEQFLPDDESTPLNLSAAARTSSTPATSSTQCSSSRKRKLGHSDVFLPNGGSGLDQSSTSPLAEMQHPSVTPGPSLPIVPVSTHRESGRMHRAHADHDEEIMALPESSSSPSLSPFKSNPSPMMVKRTKKKAQDKFVPSMTTQELQAAVMPTKLRRTARDRKARPAEFDILVDSGSPVNEPSDDSNFLPSRNARRSTRRNGTAVKSTRLQPREGNGKSARVGTKPVSGKNMARPNHEQSTREFITTVTSTVLSPSNARQGQETKSWSQLSSASKDTRSCIGPGSNLGESASEKQSGGSRPPTGRSTRETLPDKENLRADPWAPNELVNSDNQDTTVREPYGDNNPRPPEALGRKRTTNRDKWADIDAWDMDFEEVEVMTASGDSSPTRR